MIKVSVLKKHSKIPNFFSLGKLFNYAHGASKPKRKSFTGKKRGGNPIGLPTPITTKAASSAAFVVEYILDICLQNQHRISISEETIFLFYRNTVSFLD